ncbi:hypothetical protein BO1005MUT1_170163 [Hyphomicrobiales bacterium]|nr:hypothetical protein BO1005MUT1_170163 [Hyphomicrobiales bacterium]
MPAPLDRGAALARSLGLSTHTLVIPGRAAGVNPEATTGSDSLCLVAGGSPGRGFRVLRCREAPE